MTILIYLLAASTLFSSSSSVQSNKTKVSAEQKTPVKTEKKPPEKRALNLDKKDQPHLVPAEKKPDLHFILTGGLAGIRNGYEAFYSSAAFRGAAAGSLFVEDASLFSLRSKDAFFFQIHASLTEKDLYRAAESGEKEVLKVQTLQASGIMALALTSQEPFQSAPGEALSRALAAVKKRGRLEKALLADGSEIWALSYQKGPIHWPSKAENINFLRIPCARTHLFLEGDSDKSSQKTAPVFLLARSKGATPRVFGDIDTALKNARDKGEHPLFVDVGGALSDAGETSKEALQEMKNLILARAPYALGTGRAEFSAWSVQPKILDEGPYLSALTDAAGKAPPASRRTTIDGHEILFVAMGSLGKRTQALLPMSAKPMFAQESIELAGKRSAQKKTHLAIAIATSKEGQAAALNSSLFDLVFYLSSSKTVALPAISDVQLKLNHERGAHVGPTLVRVTSSDVTEVKIYFNKNNLSDVKVERIIVERTPVVGAGPMATDATVVLEKNEIKKSFQKVGLVDRALLDDKIKSWSGKDLTRLLGGWVHAQQNAEMVILRERPSPVPIHGAIPQPLADAWLQGQERILLGEVKGDVLLKIFKTLSSGNLKDRFYVTGGSRSKKTVQERPIVATETYSLAFTRDLIDELAGAGVKLKTIAESGRSLASYAREARLQRDDANSLKDLLRRADGRAEHLSFIEFSDLSLGVTGNWRTANEAYTNVENTRVQNPAYLGVALDGEVVAAHDGPWAFVGARLKSQFSAQSDCSPLLAGNEAEPAQVENQGLAQLGYSACQAQFPQGHTATFLELRDLFLAEAEARLVLHRLLKRSPTWTPSPTLKLAFQSEWTPAFEEGAKRRKELRLSLGATLNPSAVWKIINVGALIEYDLAYKQPTVDELSSISHFLNPTAGSVEAGIEGSLQMAKKIGAFTLKWNAMARAYMPAFVKNEDSDDDLLFLTQHTFRIEAPPVFGIRFGAFTDVFVAAKKLDTFSTLPAASVIMGLSVSTGGRFKIRSPRHTP